MINFIIFLGEVRGVLTRGKKWDKIFQTFWVDPIDLSKKDEIKRKKTEILIKVLNLEKIISDQQERNKLEKEELSKIKIDLNGGHNEGTREVVKEGEKKLCALNIVDELRNISNIHLDKKNSEYLRTFQMNKDTYVILFE